MTGRNSLSLSLPAVRHPTAATVLGQYLGEERGEGKMAGHVESFTFFSPHFSFLPGSALILEVNLSQNNNLSCQYKL